LIRFRHGRRLSPLDREPVFDVIGDGPLIDQNQGSLIDKCRMQGQVAQALVRCLSRTTLQFVAGAANNFFRLCYKYQTIFICMSEKLTLSSWRGAQCELPLFFKMIEPM